MNIYTGKYTYANNDNTDVLKTVKAVCELCKPFEGPHCTIFVDHFYTSIPLMKGLDKMSLCVTGTVTKKRLPAEIKINKTSKKSRIWSVDTLYHIGMSMMTPKKQIWSGVLEW